MIHQQAADSKRPKKTGVTCTRHTARFRFVVYLSHLPIMPIAFFVAADFAADLISGLTKFFVRCMTIAIKIASHNNSCPNQV